MDPRHHGPEDRTRRSRREAHISSCGDRYCNYDWPGSHSFLQREIAINDAAAVPPPPDAVEMQRRQTLRHQIQQESLERRRAVVTTSLQRNIVSILHDRQHGRKFVLRRNSVAKRTDEETKRDQSPLTVLESPVSTTAATHFHERFAHHNNNIAAAAAAAAATAAASGMVTLGNEGVVAAGNEAEIMMRRSDEGESLDDDLMIAGASSVVDETDAMVAPEDGIMLMTLLEDEDDTAHTDEGGNNILPTRVCYPMRVTNEVRLFGEHVAATKYESAFLPHLGGSDPVPAENNVENGSNSRNITNTNSSRAVSTISVAFSPDRQTLASTHGDHTVKISCCHTGVLLANLEGHPRTPWTVKFHPFDARVVASGCLGYQVRLWNWTTKTCLQMVRLEFAIISLSFHPSGQVLAIANGTRLHFWGVDDILPNNRINDVPRGDATDRPSRGASNAAPQRSTLLTEIDQRHMLRCVHFPPNGKSIIVGGVNPNQDDASRRHQRNRNNSMSFYLRLWDFDLALALHQPRGAAASDVGMPGGTAMTRRAIGNPRTFVPRALLYNDGGFDVSPDGKTLCACAEYWLPDGVDNVMELVHKDEQEHASERKRIDRLANAMEVVHDPATCPSSGATAQSAIATALSKLKHSENRATQGRSPSFRDSMAGDNRPQTPAATAAATASLQLPRTPTNNVQATAASGFQTPSQNVAGPSNGLEYVPRTPENPRPQSFRLSPPSPPGRRFPGGLRITGRETIHPQQPLPEQHISSQQQAASRGFATPPPPPPPAAPPAPGHGAIRPPHPLSLPTSQVNNPEATLQMLHNGRYVPHVVKISLDTTPIPPEVDLRLPRGKSYPAIARSYQPRLGQLLEACPLDAAKASAVTCVKFSPSTDFCLIGYGVRDQVLEAGVRYHPVTALYRISGGMTHVSTMLSGHDDVNIARFHPDSGHGFVYGTKQGRVRVLSPRPWMYYNL